MQWSEFQNAIFTAVLAILKTGRDLVVLARAGTGKTTTMVEAVIRFCRANPHAKVLTCAFNKKNAVELDGRLKDAGLDWKQAAAKTLNSVGLATVKKAWGKGVRVEPKKGRKISKDVAKRYNATQSGRDFPIAGLAGKVGKLATLAKITLTDEKDVQAMTALCNRFAVADEQSEVKNLVLMAAKAMDLSAEDHSQVDFDDQLWFPHIFEMQPWKHDLVIVDEAQDMNPSQLELARNSVKRNGRLIAVGDDRQAIYGWRGADSQFIPRMIEQLGADTLPLPRTYRCGKNIVTEAKRLVPDYEAADGNVDGLVRSANRGQMLAGVDLGDFIISRSNAPLLGICLELLKNRIPACIQGRDVMGQIIAMIERSEAESTVELLEWLDEYEAEERRKLVAADADDDVIDALCDRCACIRTLAPERNVVSDLIAVLEDLFSDRDDASRVTLSTTHRAKGLERDRVWLLIDTFHGNGEQEDNCKYVAITRAKTELVYVSGN